MTDWLPIEKYKGGPAVFYFKARVPDKNGKNELPETVQLTRNYGYRECTMFLPFDMPKTDVKLPRNAT
jgi:hypothetical protein